MATRTSLLPLLTLATLTLGGCAASEIDRPTSCASNADCTGERTCLLGFCQVGEDMPSPSQDMTPAPDLLADLPAPVVDMAPPDMTQPEDMQDMAPCVPQSCEDRSAECGTLSDGCGRTLNCGFCDSTSECQNNQCVCTDCGLWSYNARSQRWTKTAAPLPNATHEPKTPIRAVVRTKDSQEVIVFTETTAHTLELRRNPPEWTNSTLLALPTTVQGSILAAWAQGGQPEYIALLMANQGLSHVALVAYEGGLNFDFAGVQRIEYGEDWTMGALAPTDRTQLRAMWYGTNTPQGIFPDVTSATCTEPSEAIAGVVDAQKVYAFESAACFEFLYQSSQSLFAPFMLPDAPKTSLITGAYHDGDSIYFTLGDSL